jgi:membrane-bound metal-dependent hydrolase YbcI (DUF457 family)
MKGIAHFVTGVAVATFFPELVYSASQNLSFAPLLGGLAGLLPDTLDFKAVRYFYQVDEEIDPAKITSSAGSPDPQAIAARIAAAMNLAYESGEQVRLHLHTLKLGSDLWRQYSVAFDLPRKQVVARIGPEVTTAQVPYPGSEISGPKLARAQVNAPIAYTYEAETKIDIFAGPSLAFDRVGDVIQVTFMPWHRIWTHSLAMVLLLGALGFLLSPLVGLSMALAALGHILADQLGFMGCNLLFPFNQQRTMGLEWMRSGDAIPNFGTVWVSLALIVLNLDRFSDAPVIPVWPYLLGVIILPCLLLLGLSLWARSNARRRSDPPLPRLGPATMAAVEALDETDEVDI